MERKEIKHVLALSYIQGMGGILYKGLMEVFGSAEEVFNLPKKHLPSGIYGRLDLAEWNNKTLLEKAEHELDFCEKEGVSLWPFGHEKYPELLKEIYDPPMILRFKGTFNWEVKKYVAIVGTRKISHYGQELTEELVQGLAGKNVCIVSGLALGCDGTAHRKALEVNLPTLAVLGFAMNQFYPHQNRKLGKDILVNGGWLSEFSIFKKMHPSYFIQRNRIIAALSELTIVVQSDYKGGAMSTAKFANSYNREVMTFPGLVTDLRSRGCHHLVKTHQAQLITSSEDVVNFLFPDHHSKSKNHPQKKLLLDLPPEEQSIYDLLFKQSPISLDQMAISLNKAVHQITPTLLEMELKGMVRPLPGKMFTLA